MKQVSSQLPVLSVALPQAGYYVAGLLLPHVKCYPSG